MEPEETSSLQSTFSLQTSLRLVFSEEKQNEIWVEPKKALSLRAQRIGISD